MKKLRQHSTESSIATMREIRDKAIVEQLSFWFDSHARKFPWRYNTIEPWQVLVVEMFLQQTQAERVALFVPAFLADFPTLQTIVSTHESVFVKRLTSLGLQNRRAKNLIALAHALIKRDAQIPTLKTELQSLPGVGPYVAAAYMATVLNKPEPMVDVNMARLIERLYGARKLVDIRYDPHINSIAHRLIRLATCPKKFNWAILDLSAAHCRARSPSCTECPLLSLCPTGERYVGST